MPRKDVDLPEQGGDRDAQRYRHLHGRDQPPGRPTTRLSRDAVQAVTFPFTVTGPIFVRSVIGSDDEDQDEEVVLPHGTYDVLARFLPARASTSEAEADLRVLHVALDFHPAGSLGAPRCLKLERGVPPETILLRQGTP